MSMVRQFGDRGRRQADAELIVLDFLGNADQHRTLSFAWRQRIGQHSHNVSPKTGQIQKILAYFADSADIEIDYAHRRNRRARPRDPARPDAGWAPDQNRTRGKRASLALPLPS